MLFEFVDTAYSFSVPILLLLLLVRHPLPQHIFYRLLVASNFLLIGYGWYLLYQFIQLIKFVLSLNIKLPEEAKRQPINITWVEVRYLLLFILPYLFFIRKKWLQIGLAIVMLVLLQWQLVFDVYEQFVLQKSTAGVLFYMPYNSGFKILNYICLLTAVYALLWLLKNKHKPIK